MLLLGVRILLAFLFSPKTVLVAQGSGLTKMWGITFTMIEEAGHDELFLPKTLRVTHHFACLDPGGSQKVCLR